MFKMRKINKLANIAVIFTILGCWLGQGFACSSDIFCLRVPMGVDKDRAAEILERWGVAGKQRAFPMSFEEACGFLEKEYYPDHDDLEDSKTLAEEILKYSSIQTVMVVGSSLTYFPRLLALTGKKVVFVDVTPGITRPFMTRIRHLSEKLGLQNGLISVIPSEIGSLNLDAHNLSAHSFDLITFIDLVGGEFGGQPIGEPWEWLTTAKTLLKEEAFLVIDESRNRWDDIQRYFHQVFPNNRKLSQYHFRGTYPGGKNYLYRVAQGVQPSYDLITGGGIGHRQAMASL